MNFGEYKQHILTRNKFHSFVFKYSKRTCSSRIRVYPHHSITLVPCLTVSWAHLKQNKWVYKWTFMINKWIESDKNYWRDCLSWNSCIITNLNFGLIVNTFGVKLTIRQYEIFIEECLLCMQYLFELTSITIKPTRADFLHRVHQKITNLVIKLLTLSPFYIPGTSELTFIQHQIFIIEPLVNSYVLFQLIWTSLGE